MTKYVSLKLYNYKVHTGYFDCVMNATAWKVNVANMFVMCSYGVKYSKKITANYNSFWEMYQSKVYSHHVKNVWISSSTLFLVFWWIELAILRSHRQGYQNFILNFEDTRKRKQIKQSMLLTFLWLLKIVRPSDWKYKKRDYKIYPWIS